MNKVSKFFRTVVTRYYTHVNTKKWNKYKAALLVDVDDNRNAIYSTVLDNQRQYQLTEDSIYGNEGKSTDHWLVKLARSITNPKATFLQKNDYMFKLVKATLDELAIWNLVGVQPMQGPVGLVYSLQFKAPNEGGAEDNDKKIFLEVVRQTVEASTHRLAARWTIEAMTDLATQHKIGLENELVRTLATEIAQELNADILSNLYSFTEPDSFALKSTTHENMVTEIIIRIRVACNEIARQTRRGVGNWVVLDSATWEFLKTYGTNIDPDIMKLDVTATSCGNGLWQVGTLGGGVALYASTLPFSSDNKLPKLPTILVGHKGGNGQVDCGFIYSPYIIAMSTGIVIDPANFAPVKTFMTRNGKTLIGGDKATGKNYYRSFTLCNLE